jgi:hypothetical protein
MNERMTFVVAAMLKAEKSILELCERFGIRKQGVAMS